MVESMTGFGAHEAEVGDSLLAVSVRCVNHRFLDVRLRLPSELAAHEARLDRIVRDAFDRGRVEVLVRLERPRDEPRLDMDRARSALRQLVELRDEVCPGDAVPFGLLSSLPTLFSDDVGPAPEALLKTAEDATRAALKAAKEMRAKEGAAMARTLANGLERVRARLVELDRLAPRAVTEHRERLRQRIEKLLTDVSVELDPGRLEQELAILADRSDVAEEATRLASHVDQFAQLMHGADGPIGRKLEFLLQEMGRETNTVGAKSSHGEIARLVLELKSELERMRELVLNIA